MGLIKGLPFKTYEICLMKGRVYRAMNAYFTTELKSFNLSQSEWVLLGALNTEGSAQPTELATTIGVKPPVVAALIRELITKGLLNKIPSENDSRAFVIYLTNKGRRLVKEAEAKIQDDFNDFAGDISADMVKSYLDLLSKLSKKLGPRAV